jgi:phosphoribosylaminoimidazole carboxylase PurE protein
MKVAIFIGSDSDYDVVKDAQAILKEFKVSFGLEVTSAHRSPARTFKLIKDYEEKGTEVFIAVAGKAAHLAGVVASHTVKPVIGVPVESSTFDGLDALLSTVQMPKGVPSSLHGSDAKGSTRGNYGPGQIRRFKLSPPGHPDLEPQRSLLGQETEGISGGNGRPD